jgi:PAS domain S-box-containing protein
MNERKHDEQRAAGAAASGPQDLLVPSHELLRVAVAASGFGFWSLPVGDGEPRFHPEDRRTLAESLARSATRGEPLRVRIRLLRKDGSVRHLSLRGEVVLDDGGRPDCIVGACFDPAEEAPGRDTLEDTVRGSSTAMLLVDRRGVILLANAEACRLFGYSPDEFPGLVVDQLVPTETRREHKGMRESFFADARPRSMGVGRDLTAIRKDGTAVPVEVALTPVHLGSGLGVLTSVVDISQRQEMQAKVNQSERLAAIGELAAGVAHEINNPVNTIINCAQLVQDGDVSADHCRTIIEEGGRIAAIVKDLLEFARDDRDIPQATSVAEVVQRTLRLLGENLKRHGISVRTDVPEGLPPVAARPQKLQQVLLNLLINAKEALKERAARRDRPCIELRAGPGPDPARPVQVCVRDNGPGVAPQVRDRLFDPFVTTKRATGGTGLGLSISRSIIEGYGGTIEFESVPGESTEFRVSLPVAREDE